MKVIQRIQKRIKGVPTPVKWIFRNLFCFIGLIAAFFLLVIAFHIFLPHEDPERCWTVGKLETTVPQNEWKRGESYAIKNDLSLTRQEQVYINTSTGSEKEAIYDHIDIHEVPLLFYYYKIGEQRWQNNDFLAKYIEQTPLTKAIGELYPMDYSYRDNLQEGRMLLYVVNEDLSIYQCANHLHAGL